MTVRLSDVDAIHLKNGRQLIKWLEQFSRFSAKKIQVMENSENRFSIRVYTDRNIYGITATKTYLGCTAATRKSRPGEEWNRGSDLPDGTFLEKTFLNILGAIVFYELQDVIKPIKRRADEEAIERPEKIMSVKTFNESLRSFPE